MSKQYVRSETFDSYESCQDYLEYYVKTYGDSDTVNRFSITKVNDCDWRLVIVYSSGEEV